MKGRRPTIPIKFCGITGRRHGRCLPASTRLPLPPCLLEKYKSNKTATIPVRKITTTTPAIRPPVQNPLFAENAVGSLARGEGPGGLCRGGGDTRRGGGGVNKGGGGAGAWLKLFPPIL